VTVLSTANVLPNITFLPPAPQTIFYDENQFACKRTRASSSETRIAFSDFKAGMSIQYRKTTRDKRWIPAFATNPEQLRNVLALLAWRYAHGRTDFPQGLTLQTLTLQELTRMTDARFAKAEKKQRPGLSGREQLIWERYLFCYEGPGGWMKAHASVAYRSWLLGENSCQVASQLWMTPQQVRIILYRMNCIARELGYETFPSNHKSPDYRLQANRKRIRKNLLRRIRITPKSQMTGEEKKSWHRAYSEIWWRAKRAGLTMKEWRAGESARIMGRPRLTARVAQ
jgi:hypothetical protein